MDLWCWLRKYWKSWRVQAAAVGVGLPTILHLFKRILGSEEFLAFLRSEFFSLSLLVLQLTVCLILLLAIQDPRTSFSKARRASKAAEQFKTAWMVLWSSWVLIYLAFSILALLNIYLAFDESQLYPYGLAGLNLFNNIQTVALFMCYLVLARPTAVTVAKEPPGLPWLKGLIIAIIFFATEIICVLILSASDVKVDQVRDLFGLLSGLAAGLIMAMLVGRLDSKYLGIPTSIIVLLYFYVVLQVTWPTFFDGDEARYRDLILSLALAFKSIFFIVVHWLFERGILLYYLHRIADLHGEVQEDREEFLKTIGVVEAPVES